jgi:hypothetical protein
MLSLSAGNDATIRGAQTKGNAVLQRNGVRLRWPGFDGHL